ncbi:MAG: 23S rRNA (uracil(1939)-C(5))-methyltransferase RlmD [Proteobacteria bacterium]|nr:23S rRNA (uracil(1939)-C(5))-methyltransferase RlmD [Desulfobacteraceae bacterium]MBU4068153.1 23S rRNA (uracil(1939)-C(5))-methyltransferase RlmD [Pseudomonadota bacterium]MBU4102054.1 23S rRNA (uracil(1939)-C(5))-methyltransferase RlmD [Pseudomonadota bacterium]MBU4127411.1 23S rRNA (uracil(1939)-C(5))-methyltransferase RlmD [Pseudomonadota bacterium]
MSLKKGQELELEISELAFGGKGLARKDGFVVFVDQTIPLDIVIARIIKKKKNYADAIIVTIVKESPFRIKPPCIYSGCCGGCKWQFLKYDEQLVFKRQHVIDSLEHIGIIKDVPVHSTLPSKVTYAYRNKMEFSCSDRRWLMPDEFGMENLDLDFAIGLHVPGTFHKVLDIKKCLLQPGLGNNILDDIREFIKNSNIPVYGLRSHKGFWRFLMLRHSAAYDQWMVNIVTAEESNKIVKPLSDLLTAKYPEIVSVINNINKRKAGIAVGEYEILLAGSPFIRDKVGRFEFKISANSFFQTNTLGAEILYKKVMEYAGLSGKEQVVDLYCGAGTISIFLADSARELVGIEISESAVRDAEINCQNNGVTNCRFILGDIKDCLEQVKKPDVMIIDPPRTGMHEKVVKQVLDMSPARIVYVSCNPATMARDLGMIKDDYSVLEVQPVDMFPHTYHIESVARLERK